jgi:hypothetical protein
MNKILNSFLHKIRPVLFKFANFSIKKTFSFENEMVQIYKNELIFSFDDIITNITYKDETWNHIKLMGTNMWNNTFRYKFLQKAISESLTDNMCENSKVKFENAEIKCISTNKNNDWIFLLFNKEFDFSYMVEFEACIHSVTSEFQFAFNFKSMTERFRFNLINNESLNFDVIHGGFFHDQIFQKPFSLTLDVFHNFRFAIERNFFTCWIDDIQIMRIKQKKILVKNGKFAFILWDSEKSKIDAVYRNINIYSI